LSLRSLGGCRQFPPVAIPDKQQPLPTAKEEQGKEKGVMNIRNPGFMTPSYYFSRVPAKTAKEIIFP
jgi:hypothetical protein